MKLLLVLILCLSSAFASEVEEAFKRKDFKTVAHIYRDNQKKEFTPKELIYISYSLRKMGYFRQDIKLNIRLINKKYLADHKKLLTQVRKSETVDGEEYPEGLKVLYWNLMNDFGQILESYNDASELVQKDHQRYLTFSKLLSELEFREGKVDKFNDRIVAHILSLQNAVYKPSYSLSFQYISWQTETDILSSNTKTGLLITNRGLCVGGDAGIENASYHFYVDGCVFAGSGGVSNTSDGVDYQQSNVPAYGAKFGPGASMIVSSSKSRIGIKLPVIYTLQKLQQPANPAYVIKDISPISLVASIYSRWQFTHWYFQTEFGKYVQVEQTFWGLGIGKSF